MATPHSVAVERRDEAPPTAAGTLGPTFTVQGIRTDDNQVYIYKYFPIRTMTAALTTTSDLELFNHF